MGVNCELRNVSTDGDWIEGDIQVDVDELGLSFSKTQHFKTKKDVQQQIDLGNGFILQCVGTLEAPNNACVSGKISKGVISIDLPKRCVTV